MFGQKDKKERLIREIIKIGKKIKYIYDNMNLKNKESLEKELRVEITKENYLLEKLNIKESNSKEIHQDFVNLLNESLLDEFKLELKDPNLQKMFNEYMELTNNDRLYTNDLILSRFESYLIKHFRGTPTQSKEKKDNYKRRKENNAVIKHAAVIDYQTSTIRFLKELAENTDSLSIANRAISEINRNLFVDKLIEEKYWNNDLSITKKDECLEAGFKEEYVNEIYNDFITSAINEQAMHCSLLRNEQIANRENNARIAINFQLLKASLYLLDKETLQDNLQVYQGKYSSSGKKSVQMIMDTMQDVIEIKETEKGYAKTKKVI